MHKRLVLVFFVLTLVVASCGGGGGENVPPPPGGDKGAGGPAPALTGTVAGKITFEGEAPKPEKIQMSADPYCAMANKDPFTEYVKVSDGGLENVIVYVSGGLEGKTFPTPTDPVVIDQHDCHYIPHAFTIQVNQPLQIKNSDMTAHNIHMYNGENTLFNKSESAPMTLPEKFEKEGMPITVRCDVHKWMNANVGVFTHPMHTVSKAGGAFEFKAAPGTYEVTAWHEKYGTQKMMVTVPDNGKADLNFTFKASDAKTGD
jgi:plastocyanin